MIINLGNDTAIPIDSVVCIFNALNIDKSKDNMRFINSLKKKCKVVHIDKTKETKSIIYAIQDEAHYLYYSIINPATLQKRGNNATFTNLTEDI